MNDTTIILSIGALIILCLFLSNKTIRKALGLTIIIIGILLCFTGIGIIVGIPAIFIGGLFLFL